jgi:pilus assembly protein Flp/PilA
VNSLTDAIKAGKDGAPSVSECSVLYQPLQGVVMSTISSAIKTFVADEDGVTAIEYGLIAALVGVAIATAATTMSGELSSIFNYIGNKLKNSHT